MALENIRSSHQPDGDKFNSTNGATLSRVTSALEVFHRIYFKQHLLLVTVA